MEGLRIAGLFAVIPAAVLLTISFFVLFAMRKIETQGLKAFGYVVAALLWLAAALVFSAGAYTLSTGRPAMMYPMMHKIMGSHRPGMMGPGMMQRQGQGMMRMQGQAAAKNQGMMPEGNKGMMKCGSSGASTNR